jgi:hypothetical protein
MKIDDVRKTAFAVPPPISGTRIPVDSTRCLGAADFNYPVPLKGSTQ